MGDLYACKEGWGWLPGAFPTLPNPGRWLPLFERHAGMLQEAAPRVRTTSVEAAEIPARLFGESLETLRIVLESRDAGTIDSVVDIGSGGGFPGLVIAAVMPGWRVALVESLRKRAELLEQIAEALELGNVNVVAARAEEAGRGPLRETADLVTAMAVADLRELVEYAAPFARNGGLLAFPKGSRLDAELADAATALAELGVEVAQRVACRAETSSTPWTLLLTKRGRISERYPRRAGMPRKRPL